MEYRVEQLAAAAGLRVDTIRYYQGRGLLPPPRREARLAIYAEHHLGQLRRIRDLQRQGFTLDQIGRVLERDATGSEPDTLLGALVEESIGARTLRLSELASESGVPEVMIQAAVGAGLLQPLEVDGEQRFSEGDLEMARLGLALLESGFPLHVLLDQSVGHAEHVRELCERAIELFDAHIRKEGPVAGDDEAVTAAFRRLLPMVTRLVAVHFQRTLVTQALQRLEGKDELGALRAALQATESSHLEVDVSWR